MNVVPLYAVLVLVLHVLLVLQLQQLEQEQLELHPDASSTLGSVSSSISKVELSSNRSSSFRLAVMKPPLNLLTLIRRANRVRTP